MSSLESRLSREMKYVTTQRITLMRFLPNKTAADPDNTTPNIKILHKFDNKII